MMTLIKSTVVAVIFLLSGCSNIKDKKANNLSVKYEIVDAKACSSIAYIEGGGKIYSKGITKKIDVQERYFFKGGDMIYLEKGSLIVIEAPDKSKVLLGSRQKKSSYRIKAEVPASENCK